MMTTNKEPGENIWFLAIVAVAALCFSTWAWWSILTEVGVL